MMKFDMALEAMCDFEAVIRAESNGVSINILTDDREDRADLRLVVQVVTSVTKIGKPLFLPVRPGIKKGKRVIDLELALLGIMDIDFNKLISIYPSHQLNPIVNAFVSLLVSFRDYEGFFERRPSVLHEFTERLILKLKGKEVQAKLSGFSRAANKVYKGLDERIDSWFASCSRLLIVRLDLGYKNVYCTPASSLGVSYNEAKRHRQKLLKYFRDMKSLELVGWAWKLEYGLAKTYHYHLLLCFNGAANQQDISIAQGVGEYWVDVITGGMGLYHNCNRHKEEYKKRGILGIGMIKHDDAALKAGLKTVAAYLTKVDYYVRMVIAGGGRCFGKSGKPPDRKAGRGRPRLLN